MSKIAFKQEGEVFQIAKVGQGNIHMELPSATYEVMFHPEKGFWLERMSNMTLTDTTYGDDSTALVNRAMRAFDANNSNLGVALIGRKGSGKTRTLKLFSGKAIEMMMPVIVVSQCFSGPHFNEWIGQIEQPIMMAFDEFDKVYAPSKEENDNSNPRAQDGILALLQGTVTGGKKLFIFTANKDEGISDYLKNRPGRIRYTKYYEGLSQAAILDYAKQHLGDKSDEKIAGLLGVSRLTRDFSFDMLQAIVSEMNLFKENAYEAAELMVTQMRSHGDDYILNVRKDGEIIDRITADVNRTGTPDFHLQLLHDNVKGGEWDDRIEVLLKALHFKRFGETLNDMVYEKDGYEYEFLLVPPLGEGKKNQLLQVQPHGRAQEWLNIQTANNERVNAVAKAREEKRAKTAAGKKEASTTASRMQMLFGQGSTKRDLSSNAAGIAGGWESLEEAGDNPDPFRLRNPVFRDAAGRGMVLDAAHQRAEAGVHASPEGYSFGSHFLSRTSVDSARLDATWHDPLRADHPTDPLLVGEAGKAGLAMGEGKIRQNSVSGQHAGRADRRRDLIKAVIDNAVVNRADTGPDLDFSRAGPPGYAPTNKGDDLAF